jgi:hypothetical protein
MTRKTKTKRSNANSNKIRELQQQLAAVKIKAKTPFSNAGALVGARAGQMFNMPMLKGVGKWLGSGIGSIFGSGDYQLAGAVPQYNVLANGAQIPKFSSTHATNIVCHREYLGDIMGTVAFNNTSYPLNPGMADTFPWLSSIADNYQEYKFHGVIFEFRPLITDFVTGGAPGVVVMATNYNADLPVYTTKQIMENSEYAVSVKPTNALIHGVECSPVQTDPNIKYVRNGALASGQDLKNYDWGNFQFATQSNPVQNLGELWVSYCVEFYKPVLATTSGPAATLLSYHNARSTTAAGSAPLGSIQTSTSGALTASATGTAVTWTGVAAQKYLIDVSWSGGTSVTIVPPVVTFTNATAQLFYRTGNDNYVTSPANPSTTVTRANYQAIVSCTAAGNVVATFGLGGTLPTTTTTCDIFITLIDATITA